MSPEKAKNSVFEALFVKKNNAFPLEMRKSSHRQKYFCEFAKYKETIKLYEHHFEKANTEFRQTQEETRYMKQTIEDLRTQMKKIITEYNNVVSQQFIKVNGQKGNYWIVTEGLLDTDKVVIKGLQKVQVGTKVEILKQSENAEQNENDKDILSFTRNKA